MKSAGCLGGSDRSSGRGRPGDGQVTAGRQGTSTGGDGNFGEGRRENGGTGKESWSAGQIRAERGNSRIEELADGVGAEVAIRGR